MPVNELKYQEIVKPLKEKGVTLVAVSKTKPITDIQRLLELGQLDFGENYVQELVEKQAQLPAGIRWHFIGHLQTNKVKLIVPFVYLVHSVDSLKLLKEIDKQAAKAGRVVDCLLQVHIAREETKFGLSEQELLDILAVKADYRAVNIKGLMGMATLTDNAEQVRSEYRFLKQLFDRVRNQVPGGAAMNILSMGMSGDYAVALEEGSTMVRIGSLIFGDRNYA